MVRDEKRSPTFNAKSDLIESNYFRIEIHPRRSNKVARVQTSNI